MTVKNVTIIGTGVIGMSWALFFLANGFKVTANDIDPQGDTHLKEFIKKNWGGVIKATVTLEQALKTLHFTTDLKEALKNADFVVENGPERLDFKQKLYNQIDEILPPHVLVGSSTSGLPMSAIQEGVTKHPERFLVTHPFNPPHLMPLVEIVGGKKTKVEYLDTAQAFFDKLGKKTIRLKKEMPGHIANRLAEILFREILYLIQEDAISVTDVDTAVSWGVGLRWGIMGQNMLYHLGGGEGGIEHFFAGFREPLTSAFKMFKSPDLNDELIAKVTKGVHEEAGKRTIDELEKKRDDLLVKFIKLREESDKK